MAKGVTIKGFKEFDKKLATMPKRLLEDADFVVKEAAGNFEQRAKQDAPVNQGGLQRSISSFRQAPGNWEVVSPSEYSAWVEWGTKSRVRVPAELSQYAAQFRGRGSGTDAKRMIYEWCRLKGIDPKLWYVIFRSIMVNGIYPHPYFFIQAPIVEKELIADLKAIIASYD